MAFTKEPGFRTSILIPKDVEAVIQSGREHCKNSFGFAPSRSAMMSMIIRAFGKDPNWKTKIEKDGLSPVKSGAARKKNHAAA